MMHTKFFKIFLIIILFSVLFVQYQHRSPKRHYSDFHMLYSTGKRFLNREAIYTFEGNISYYKYTPFYAFFIAPLTLLSERAAANIWFLLNILFILTVFYCLKKLLIVDKEKFNSYTLFYTLGAISISRFLIGNFHQGQSNIFMMCLFFIGLYLLSQKRENLGSFFIAFSIMIKYMPVLFLPYFLFKKNFKLVSKIVLAIFILGFLPALVIGPEGIINLLHQQSNFLFKSSLDTYSITCFPNQSLLASLNRFLSKDSFYSTKIANLSGQVIFFIFFTLAVLLYSLAIIPKKNIREENFYSMFDIALISVCIGLFNPNAWKNFFIWLLPAFMLIIYYLIKRNFKDKIVLTMTILSFILCTLTSEFFVKSWAGDNFEIYSSITFGALVLFFAIAKIKFSKSG